MTNNGRCRRRGVGADNDNEIAVERRHYEKAWRFYFENGEDFTRKTEYGRQINRLFKRLGLKISSLKIDELWADLVIEKTAMLFAMNENIVREKLDSYILTAIRRIIIRYVINGQKINKKISSINIISDERQIHPTTEVFATPSAGELYSLSGVRSYVEQRILLIFGPIAHKVYCLSYREGLTDNEIYEHVKIPKGNFKNIRRRIRQFLIDNKYDILTELGLVDNDL